MKTLLFSSLCYLVCYSCAEARAIIPAGTVNKLADVPGDPFFKMNRIPGYAQYGDNNRPLFFSDVMESGKQDAAINEEDKIIVTRIEYFYRLKSLVDKSVWKGFDDPAFELPLIYYTDKHCYVANPTNKFLFIYQPPLIYQKRGMKIYKTGLLDSISFHMESTMNLEDTASYNYKSLFMKCSSLEMTKLHPEAEVTYMERWLTFILHEYFHGFQFMHPDFSTYHKDSILPVQAVTLRNIYMDNEWIKESIDEENNLLLSAIKTENLKDVTMLIDSFFVRREKRRNMIKESSGFDMGKYEQFYETVEGTARYIEYGLINAARNKKTDRKLMCVDTAYHGYQYFRTYQLEDEPSMYLTSETNYVYAIGFNMARLADKLQLPYKERLFEEPRLSLEQILHSFVNNN